MSWVYSSLRNIFRNFQRAVITISVLIFGFVGIILIAGYIYRVERFIYTQTIYTNQNGQIIITEKNGFNNFFQSPRKLLLDKRVIDDLVSYLKSLDEVLFVGRKLSGVGLISTGNITVPFVADGYDERERRFSCKHPLVNMWNSEFIDPNCDTDYSLEQITITKNLARSLHLKSDNLQEVQLLGRTFDGHLNGLSVKIRSYHSTGMAIVEDNSLRAPNEVLAELFQTSGFWRVQAYLKDENQMQNLKGKIQLKFPDLEVMTYKENGIDSLYKGMMSFLYVMGVFFFFLILGTVSLSLINSLTVSILERSKELGTLRSIGYSRKQISLMIAMESVVMATITGVVGTLLSIMISYVINSANFRLRPINTPSDIQFVISPTWEIVVATFIFFLLVSFVVSWILCQKVLNRTIITLLNDSGSRG